MRRGSRRRGDYSCRSSVAGAAPWMTKPDSYLGSSRTLVSALTPLPASITVETYRASPETKDPVFDQPCLAEASWDGERRRRAAGPVLRNVPGGTYRSAPRSACLAQPPSRSTATGISALNSETPRRPSFPRYRLIESKSTGSACHSPRTLGLVQHVA